MQNSAGISTLADSVSGTSHHKPAPTTAPTHHAKNTIISRHTVFSLRREMMLLASLLLATGASAFVTQFSYPNINNAARQNMTLISTPIVQPSNALRMTDAVPYSNVSALRHCAQPTRQTEPTHKSFIHASRV